MDNLTWKVKNSKRTGPQSTTKRRKRGSIPGAWPCARSASLKLAADGWRPVTERDAEATGASAGFGRHCPAL